MIKNITNKVLHCLTLCTLVFGVSVLLTSCSVPTDLNDNPNEITVGDVEAKLFLNGAQLANTQVQAGHVNRITGLFSGQLTGFASVYSNVYGYSLSAAEINSLWNHLYIGVLTNVRYVQVNADATGDKLMLGIAKVVEAHAFGTAAAIFGDIPYSESGTGIEDPKFDSQKSVFQALASLLDSGIADLQAATSRSEEYDIYFEGDAAKWVEAAYTLKARYLLQMKDYAGAYAAALNGISTADGDMLFKPRGDASSTSGDKNLFWTILAGSRGGDIGTGDSYLMGLLDPTNGASRNNIKTDETARFGYNRIDESGGVANKGVVEQFEPHRLVTYSENLLILAECGARTAGVATGLGHLNEVRSYLNNGGWLNAAFDTVAYKYEAYLEADFAAGGIENLDNIAPERALLREIIEERFVSGFGTFMPFNDSRRLRKSDGDIAVPFPLNTPSATQYVERILYAQNELNSNTNAPSDPGIYATTEVNQ